MTGTAAAPPDRPPPRAAPRPATPASVDAAVPTSLKLAAAYSWRLLVVGAAVVALALLVAKLWLVVLPVFLAVLATALLRPPADWLRRRGWPDAAAAGAAIAAATGAFGGVLVLILPPFLAQLGDLGGSLAEGIDRAQQWLVDGPLGLSERELQQYVDGAADELRANSDAVVSGVLSGAQLAGEILVTLALTGVLTFFFLKDGRRIWDWLVALAPARHRPGLRAVGERSWTTLGRYLRGVTIVALFDAVLIGAALVAVGVPAALPLAVLTFFGAYVPIAGAVVTGLVAVLVTLVSNGPAAAAIIAAAVIVVQQVESNVLQPVVVGRAVAVHPVAVLLAVTAGGLLAGIIGALLAVPLTAVAARVRAYVHDARASPPAVASDGP